MSTNSSRRRDRVAKLKIIMNIIMIICMIAVAVYASVNLVWQQYFNSLSVSKQINASVEDCLNKYIPQNQMLVISYVICCMLAFGFLVFLVFKGIQTIIIKIMMRKANI